MIREYFEWLLDFVCDEEYDHNRDKYHMLLRRLFDTDFYWKLPMDKNRATDGIDLRDKFAQEFGYIPLMPERSSILEMMIALAIRCEVNIMGDPEFGDRTAKWFWDMIDCLGLSPQHDRQYSEREVDDILETFLEREYTPHGLGGLFYVSRNNVDLRVVEIWYQMCWHLDELLNM